MYFLAGQKAKPPRQRTAGRMRPRMKRRYARGGRKIRITTSGLHWNTAIWSGIDSRHSTAIWCARERCYLHSASGRDPATNNRIPGTQIYYTGSAKDQSVLKTAIAPLRRRTEPRTAWAKFDLAAPTSWAWARFTRLEIHTRCCWTHRCCRRRKRM